MSPTYLSLVETQRTALTPVGVAKRVGKGHPPLGAIVYLQTKPKHNVFQHPSTGVAWQGVASYFRVLFFGEAHLSLSLAPRDVCTSMAFTHLRFVFDRG